VVVVSGRDDANIVARCLDAGAMGFVPKNADAQTVIEALRVVADGAVYVPPSAQRALSGAAHGDSAVAEARAREGIAALTPRQRDVLRAMIRGLPNKLIARELELSDNTVKAHVSAVLRAFAARNRTEAVLVAGRLRLRVSDALSDHAPDAAN
jgi:DNA-binding NarL/FixJ family response regulator